MSRPTRWAVAVFLFLAPLAGLTYAYPEWPSDAGLDFWTVSSLRSEAEQGQRRRDELEAQLGQTARRMKCKAEIAQELIDGHITLREAIVAFRAANADNPYFVRVMRYRYPRASDDELQARNVLDTVEGLLVRDQRRAEILARLTADFEALLQPAEG